MEIDDDEASLSLSIVQINQSDTSPTGLRE